MRIGLREGYFFFAVEDPHLAVVGDFVLAIEVPYIGVAGGVGEVCRHLLPRLVEDFCATVVPLWPVAAGVGSSPGVMLLFNSSHVGL